MGNEDDVVLMLTAKIQELTRILLGSLRLLFKGRKLEMDLNLRDYAIKKDDSIALVACMNGIAKGGGHIQHQIPCPSMIPLGQAPALIIPRKLLGHSRWIEWRMHPLWKFHTQTWRTSFKSMLSQASSY